MSTGRHAIQAYSVSSYVTRWHDRRLGGHFRMSVRP
jgi:hypothetical protein